MPWKMEGCRRKKYWIPTTPFPLVKKGSLLKAGRSLNGMRFAKIRIIQIS